MKSKYLSTISKLVYLVTLILLFIISKKNIQIQKFTLILIMGINIFSFVAALFLSEISKKLKFGLILALVIF
ncbi:MAG: hypothetical protein E7K74_04430, partial [Finegoldia magna]|nr:hypothetical protein [Finegoldia magna]